MGKNIGETLELADKLKKSNHNITVSTPVIPNEESNFIKLKNKNIKFVPINEPPGYKVGDGNWGFNTPDGFIKSEPNKLYWLGGVNFDLTHAASTELTEHLKKLYPDTPSVTVDGTIDEITNVYQTVLK
jgi:hypothetical protein